ncbi:hypothetical protein GCM10008905_25220 [Clostridium malenominatum]|uniref:Uncharacterized protein n=1 Tax=Clostridium malenominatum TaxID=1539 RepID=A0ABN1J3Z0_9CLOT
MFTRMPNDYYEYPMWDEIPVEDFDLEDIDPLQTREVIPPGGTTGGPDFTLQPGPPVQTDINYTQGWLKTQIGKYIKIEFLIGTNMLIDREGVLLEVGISYIVIRESGTNDQLMCDIYAIKFVRIFDNQEKMLNCR